MKRRRFRQDYAMTVCSRMERLHIEQDIVNEHVHASLFLAGSRLAATQILSAFQFFASLLPLL